MVVDRQTVDRQTVDDLAQRIRAVLGNDPQVHERRMFGGHAFLVNGNLAVSASGRGGLLVRVDPADGEELLGQRHVEPFEMRGRDLAGWLHVLPAAIRSDDDLARWVRRGAHHARTLPPKRGH